jgi:sugar lactone lactonase YvrE
LTYRIRNSRGLLLVALLLGACAKRETAPPAKTAADTTPPAPAGPSKISTLEGFKTPESVRWDPEQGVWFVSNINGNPSIKDNNGFISRLKADGSVDSLHFISAGRGGVTLNAPKGLAVIGDTLWVADIDAVRGFNRKTGALVANVDAGHQAKFLNDVAASPDGTVYITDTGIQFDPKGGMTHPGPDRIFALKGRKLTVAAEGDWLERPNGITWDQANGRFLLAPFGGPHIDGWKPGVAKVDTVGTGPGGQDGIEILPDGRVLITSWADSTVFTLNAGVTTKLITGVPSPADIGLDPARGWVAVPVFTGDRVEFWSLGK